MGVHAVGRGQHLALGLAAQVPQSRKGHRRGLGFGGLPGFGAGLKIGSQRGGAAHKGKGIHVLVAAAVPAVHKAGLGGGGHLIQQGADGLLGGGGGVQLREGPGQDLRGLFLQGGHGVDTAAAAHLGGPAAEEAAAALQLQLFPVYFPPVRAQDVHIKQPPQRAGILHEGGHPLDLQRRSVQHIEGLAPGDSPADIGVKGRPTAAEELPLQQLPPPGKAPPDERRILHRPGDVHGKADQRLSVPGQQLLLVVYPALPGVQHLDERYFFHFYFLFLSISINNCTCGRATASRWQKI